MRRREFYAIPISGGGDFQEKFAAREVFRLTGPKITPPPFESGLSECRSAVSRWRMFVLVRGDAFSVRFALVLLSYVVAFPKLHNWPALGGNQRQLLRFLLYVSTGRFDH